MWHAIREAKADDIMTMAELDKLCFTTPWSLNDFITEILNNELANYLVCEHDGRVIGYAGLWAIFTEGHITNVAIHPDFQNSGLGSALVQELISWSEEALGLEHFTLEVRVSNGAAIRLYEKFGFKEEGRRKGYYSDTGEDAIIMWRMKDEAGAGHEG